MTESFTCTTTMASSGTPIGYQEPAQWSTALSVLQRYSNLPASVSAKDVFTDKLFTGKSVSHTACRRGWS